MVSASVIPVIIDYKNSQAVKTCVAPQSHDEGKM